MKKIGNVLMVCFVFCVMLGISNVSLAADPTEIYIIDVVGESEVKVDALSDQKGNGWSWDATNKVLTLDNFNGEYINTNGDITINLVGANKITIGSKGYGIIANGNAECLIINGTSSDILKINGTSADVRAGIYANSLIIYGGKLDIDISISKATSNVYGIFTDKSTELYNDANIDALVEVLQSTGTWNLVGIKSLTGVGTGEVTVNVTGVNKVCGIEFLNLNSGNDVEITTKTSSATDFAHACEKLA